MMRIGESEGCAKPHTGLVRLVVAEQLYRAVTILNGHPYYRG